MKKYLISLSIIIFFVVFSGAAGAALLTYKFEGIGTGTVDGVNFTDREFVISVFSDPEDVTAWPPSPDRFRTADSPATVLIDSFGLGSFTTDKLVFVVQGGSASTLGFTEVGPPMLDLLNMLSLEFDSYDLTTQFGPVTSSIIGGVGQFTNIPTSLGPLTFTDIDSVTFTAVPIPGAVWLLGSSLICLIGLRRKENYKD